MLEQPLSLSDPPSQLCYGAKLAAGPNEFLLIELEKLVVCSKEKLRQLQFELIIRLF